MSTPVKRKTPSQPTPTASTTLDPLLSAIAINVVVRVRPPNTREIELAKTTNNNDLNFYNLSEDAQAITFDNIAEKPNWSRFDQVFDIDSNQEDLFHGTAEPIVRSYLQGYNGCIMAYGQTGSGKTFSMTGPKDALTNPENEHLQGIIPRALTQLFESIASQSGMFFFFLLYLFFLILLSICLFSNFRLTPVLPPLSIYIYTSPLSSTIDTKFQLQCSYLEIYNEQLRDLLSSSTAAPTPATSLAIVNVNNNTVVKGLTMVPITSVQNAISIMERGFSKRQTAQTKMNNESSRSHAIFTVYLTSQSVNAGGNSNSNVVIQRSSKLHFVDLAGSESSAKTGAKGKTQLEGANINQSLLQLGKVIREVAQYEQQSAATKKANPLLIAYRGSKLTHLLQDSFGKGNPLCLVANISPSRDNITESKSTLIFASEARSLPKTVINPKAKIIGTKEDVSNDNGKDGGEGDIETNDYQRILKAFCNGQVDVLDALLEQSYHTAMLWKRQRNNQYSQTGE
jgi:hypothetical protein